MSQEPTFFADGLTEATVRNGVARLAFSTQGGDGRPVSSLTLALPVQQVPNVANALIRLLRELEAKAKEMRETQAENGAAPVASGLRFES